ncbi:MAG: sugar phosphate nucleotidyltransferase [Cellulosilyticaceae bacterium]
MVEPVLVIMAAGMGSRYGGLKQIDPIGSQGEIIMDFSVYDAIQAGFKKVVFIIKKENELDFKETIGDRLSKIIDVSYVYQQLDLLPAGYEVPDGRVKPWGTGHAILCCKDVVDGPFAAINADDYYGQEAFKLVYDYLKHHQDDEKYRYTMVGYVLENTLTDHGYVARGICESQNGYLTGIKERTHIERKDDLVQFLEGDTYTPVDPACTVSMNLWGFTSSFFNELEMRFTQFLDHALINDPLKAEYFLPNVVGTLINEESATVKVLESKDKWYGVTYKEDKPVVVAAIQALKEKGIYPENLWEDYINEK